jgi:hypothetical protein
MAGQNELPKLSMGSKIILVTAPLDGGKEQREESKKRQPIHIWIVELNIYRYSFAGLTL